MHHMVYRNHNIAKLFGLIMSEAKLAGLVRKYLRFMDKKS